MMIQLQLSTSRTESTGAEIIFNKRLSRVVTRLFTLALKAEETATEPFSSPAVDIEALLCSIEDLLIARSDALKESQNVSDDALVECATMAKSIVTALLRSRTERGGTEEIRGTLVDLGIDPEESLLASLVKSCQLEMRSTFDSSLEKNASAVPANRNTDVATLVSNVGSATEGPERVAALDALRQYKEANGDSELTAHLDEVSAAFRAYILEQLSKSSPPRPAMSGSANQDDQRNLLPMSERIRQIQSKLQTTEAAVLSAVDSSAGPLPSTNSRLPKLEAPARSSVQTETPQKNSSSGERISKLPPPGGLSAFKKRLAAQQENRGKSENQDSSRIDFSKSSRSGSSIGQAAVLRARLEAVKHQGKQHQNSIT